MYIIIYLCIDLHLSADISLCIYDYIYKYTHIHNIFINTNYIKHTDQTFSDSAKSTVSFITREQRYMKIVA